jgi:uncharacterized protein (DUF427 family)
LVLQLEEGRMEATSTVEGRGGLIVRPYPGIVRVELGGYLLAHSATVLELLERGYGRVLYFPRESLHGDRLLRSETTTWCPRKGSASYLTAAVGSCWVEDIAWTYESPIPTAQSIAGYVAFFEREIDGWNEHGERVMGSGHGGLDCGCAD